MVKTIILGSLLLILEIVNIICLVKNKGYKYKQVKKSIIFMLVYSFIICITILIFNRNVYDMLYILLLCIPLSYGNINNDDYIYLKYIITENTLTKEIVKKFNKAGIHFIKSKGNELKFMEVSLINFKKNEYNKNLYIKDKINKKDIDCSLIYNDDLDVLYNVINKNRGIIDNYVKGISYVILSSILFSLAYVILVIGGFPVKLVLSDILLIKLLIVIVNRYIYSYLPKDVDLMERKSRIKNILFGKQEIFLMLFQLLVLLFGLTFPYMYFLNGGVSNDVGFMILMIIYLYMLLFNSIICLTEKIFIRNILYIFKNIYLDIYIVLVIGCSLLFKDIFKLMSLNNYFACIVVAIICTIVYDITKFARFTSIRKEDRSVKNNKKYRRS